MTAFVIVEIDVCDAVQYEQYKALAPASIAACGGRYLARGGAAGTLEGDWVPKRIVVLEFPDMERARTWATAPEYAHIRQLRHQAAVSRMIVVDGIPAG